MLQNGQRVQIQYAGSIETGYMFVNTWINGGPVGVTIGETQFLPQFENALRCLSRGERAVVHIPAENAYGRYDEANVVRVPKSSVPNADKLPVGSTVSLQTHLGQVRVKVASVDGDEIVFDCNHELAGHDLTFEIELVRDGRETAVDCEKAPHSCGCGCDKLKEQLSREGCGCGHDHHHARSGAVALQARAS